MPRAVLDTNVVLAAYRTTHPSSPNLEVVERWLRGEFTLLYSDDVLMEYARKLLEHGHPRDVVTAYLTRVRALGVWVAIQFYHLRRYTADADDIGILLCAINGNATHLVTYDAGFEPFSGEFGFAVCEPLEFLRELRAAQAT